MSKITAALEVAVATVIENTPTDDSKPTHRQRANVDRAFARILALIAPRIRHFVRQYGLTMHWDDAEQCCAIAVHRAIQAYDPTKAQFTTFVNWQLRGELQSLRFRLMADQRPSAKKVDATTVSLHSVAVGAEGDETMLEALLVDEGALECTEAGASDYLAKRATTALVDEYVKTSRKAGLAHLRKQQPRRALAKVQFEGPRFRNLEAGLDPVEIAKLDEKLARDREILERRVFGDGNVDNLGDQSGITKERVRQISKRATKAMAELAASDMRFRIMAELSQAAVPQKSIELLHDRVAGVGLLADPNLPHNIEMRVVAVSAQAGTQEFAADKVVGFPAHADPAVSASLKPMRRSRRSGLAA